jgi:trehalose 6-phosphate synthase
VSPRRTQADEIVIVANRLPVVRADDGSWEVSPGGLVSALAPIVQAGHGSWVGWAGTVGTPPKAFDHGGMRLTPVGLNAREIEGFYEGFANRTLWPLYHDAVRPPEFRREWWQSYVETNERFAEVAARVASRGATVWVHDYQLHLVPALLRALRPDLRIGFFLHIPLPPQELFMQLPWRQQIVEGMLGADLVGFQRPVAAQNFLLICRRLVGVTPTRATIPYHGRTVRAGAFPVSIDFAEFDAIAARPSTIQAATELREALGSPRRILLGVDRLDYTKGIDVRLQAFRELLDSGVTTAGETVLVQVATPSRERVTTYRQLRERVERAVGRINGEFGRLGHPAIHYQHHNLPREELCALYAAADVMLVTPLRDGMNLVCKEYVASRHRGGGALVLSEFAGAAGELRQALLVNPHDVVGLRETIARAIALPEPEARRRMREMRRQVRTHDVHRFARTFLEALAEPGE